MAPHLQLNIQKPPYPPSRDPLLQPDLETLRGTGDFMLALDIAEFDGIPYPNLDHDDQGVYLKAYLALINFSNQTRFGRPFRHPRSDGDRRSRARLTLRALKQVSDGVRPKLKTTGYLIKPGQL